MTRLLQAALGVLHPLLPPGRDLPAWHTALTAEIAAHLSPAHAAVLARPEPSATGTAWITNDAGTVRYSDLPMASRRALEAALGAILSDIRRLAESGAGPAVRDAWPALCEVPDLGHVFAADGRPVLAAWGHASTGAPDRLARFDDGIPWRAVPRPPWRLYGTALGSLGALALAAGLLLPLASAGLMSDWFVPGPAACAIVPGQREAMLSQAAEENRTAELRTLLATVTEEVGRRQLQCPIPVLPAPPPARPQTPIPPATPPPRADLPQDRWNRRDVSLLEGCWTLTTGIRVGPNPASMVPVRTWRMCFDTQGAGNETVQLENDTSCEAPLAASFEGGDQLRVAQRRACAGPRLTINRNDMLCRRLSDTDALCTGTNTSQGGLAGTSYTGRFRR